MDLTLNDAQTQAVTHPGGPLLVLAGAGSGKTRVLTERIRWLISQGVPPAQIMAVTFTNRAAREIVHRLGPDGKDVQAGTFHGLAARLLRAHRFPSGTFKILDEDDAYRVFRDLARDLDRDLDRAKIQEGYAALMSLRDAGREPTGDDPELVRTILPLYVARLEELDAVDFPGLLLFLRELAMDNADLQARFMHILVDEYQDTNPVQAELVSLLGSEHGNVTAVGDPGQCIYTWRGADPRNIMDFPEQWPGATVVKLEENYRSAPQILDAANAILDGMSDDRYSFRLRPMRENRIKDHVVLYVADNEWNEAERVARHIAGTHERQAGRLAWSDFAVIYRSNYQSRAIEKHLNLLSIPYRIVGGLTLYERAEVRDILAYLRIWLDPNDDPAILRVMNVPARGLGEKTQATLGSRGLWSTLHRATGQAPGQSGQGQGQSRLAQLLIQAGAKVLPSEGQGLLKGKAAQGVRQFLDAFAGLAERPDKSCADLMITIMGRIGYQAHIARDEEKELDRAQSIAHLKDLLVDVPMTRAALRTFLQDAALAEEQARDKGSDAVICTTAHSAKGLEWPVVYAIGWEEGVFPSPRSDQEEERRLAYVIATRARDKLFLGHSQMRLQEPREPGKFLLEIRERMA